MLSATVREARLNLSKLLHLVEQGEEIVIRNRKRPVARLVPWSARVDNGSGFSELAAFRQRLLDEGYVASGPGAEVMVREDRDGR